MLGDMVFLSCAALWWAGFFLLLSGWRRKSGDKAFRLLLVAFAIKGVALLLADSTVLTAVDDYTGIPNLAILLQHLTGGLAFTTVMLAVLAYWAYPRRHARRVVRIQTLACCGAATALSVLWLFTSADLSGHVPNYLVENADRTVGAAYLLLYTVMIGLGLLMTTRLCWQCAKRTQSRHLRLSLRMTATGAIVYLVHPLNRAFSVVAEQIGMDPLRWEALSWLAIGVGTLLFVGGLTLPALAQLWSRLTAWLESYRTYRKIRPLWSALYRAMPEIALEPAGRPLIDIRYRLYRTVIEIRDGWRALGPELDPESAWGQGRAVGRSGVALSAFVEAQQLKAAIETARAGMEREPVTPSIPIQGTHTSQNFSGELAWLSKVAEEFTRD